MIVSVIGFVFLIVSARCGGPVEIGASMLMIAGGFL